MTTNAPALRHCDPRLATDGVEFFAMRIYPGTGDDTLAATISKDGRHAFATREEAQAVIDQERARNGYAQTIARGERLLADETNVLNRAEIEQTLATCRGIDYAVFSRTVSAALPA